MIPRQLRVARPTTWAQYLVMVCALVGCAADENYSRPPTEGDTCDDACVQRELRTILAILDRGRIQDARDRLETMRPRPSMSDPMLRLVLAILALEGGEPTQALIHAEWLSVHARTPSVAAMTCRILVRLGEARRAATFAQQRVNEGLVSPSLYLELANAWEALGQQAPALRALQDGLLTSPNDPILLETAAARADAAGDRATAIELYARAIPHHASPALMHEAIARVATEAARYDLAVTHARQAVELAGDQDPQLYRVLHDALLGSGDADAARAALERGRRRFPQATILGES